MPFSLNPGAVGVSAAAVTIGISDPLFEVGDEVRLRTELKTFIVASVDGAEVTCEWLDERHKLNSWTFNQRMLVLVKSAA